MSAGERERRWCLDERTQIDGAPKRPLGRGVRDQELHYKLDRDAREEQQRSETAPALSPPPHDREQDHRKAGDLDVAEHTDERTDQIETRIVDALNGLEHHL